MSYKVLCDGEILCADMAEDLALIDPVLTLEANKAGSFTFTMPPRHAFYDRVQLRQSTVQVYQGDDLIFEGVPVQESTDFWNRKTIDCDGELAYLNDTVQRQAKFTNETTATLLGKYLQVHNDEADAGKQFQLGAVTVNGGNSIYRYTNYESTLKEISEDLLDNFGGFLRVRHQDGVRYLDYLQDSPRTSSQVIRIGQNLMDLTKNLNSLDVCTVVIPLGETTGESEVEGLDKRLTIESVNDGKDYLIGTAAGIYGSIWKTATFDGVTTPDVLKARGQQFLEDTQWANLCIEATALDLGLTTEDIERFQILDMIRVISEPHGINRLFMLTKMKIELNRPWATQITLGVDENPSLSAQSARVDGKIQEAGKTLLVDASNNARQILEAATGGTIYMVYDENGVATELRIMDTNNPDTAQRFWRWNINGWGYTNDGGATYAMAATMDGTIFADLIKAGKLSSDNGKFYLDMATGQVVMSQAQINGGWMRLRDDAGGINGQINLIGRNGDNESWLNSQSITMSDYAIDKRVVLNPNNISLVHLDGDGNADYNYVIISGGNGGGYISLVDSSGYTRVQLNRSGLVFYDSTGTETKRYSAT